MWFAGTISSWVELSPQQSADLLIRMPQACAVPTDTEAQPRPAGMPPNRDGPQQTRELLATMPHACCGPADTVNHRAAGGVIAVADRTPTPPQQKAACLLLTPQVMYCDAEIDD